MSDRRHPFRTSAQWFGLLAAVALLGCSTATTTSTSGRTSATPSGGPERIGDMLPTAPQGFAAPVDVASRNRDDIFEQINGGSFSFLENGMTDAMFATYLQAGSDSSDTSIIFEVYRFSNADGASAQFERLNGTDGKPWEGAVAVIHDYGLELVDGRIIVRTTFNDGDTDTMLEGSKALARAVLARTRGGH